MDKQKVSGVIGEREGSGSFMWDVKTKNIFEKDKEKRETKKCYW